jgi:hypothetical protein
MFFSKLGARACARQRKGGEREEISNKEINEADEDAVMTGTEGDVKTERKSRQCGRRSLNGDVARATTG